MGSVSEPLRRRLTGYILHRWKLIKTSGTELADASELLRELPPCVAVDAVQSMTEEALSQVPLFARVETGFMCALTQRMEAIDAAAGVVLMEQGQVNDTMFIILRGEVSIRVHGAEVATLASGGFVGEQSLLSRKPAGASVVTRLK